MKLPTELHQIQRERWPQTGRHILAQYDANSIIVYQAYRPAIGHYAVQHQTFGGEFSFNRMSWIKTNFLWMMYRSGWGTKTDQEITLAIRMHRSGFDTLLHEAVPSSFDPDVYPNEADWKTAVANSLVRLQWDPDHDPHGGKLERRAVQLGMRDTILAIYAHDWIIEIDDISDFVAEQRDNVAHDGTLAMLRTPVETVYPFR